MKKLLVVLMIVALVLFVSCDSVVQNHGGTTINPGGGTTTTVRSVKFDFSGAEAVAQLEKQGTTSRAAVAADSLGDFVKVLADGTMQNAITVEEGTTLADIVGVYKSPLESSQDVFILFKEKSIIGYKEVRGEDPNGGGWWRHDPIYLGQLICVHQDGSIADILKTGNSNNEWCNYLELNQNNQNTSIMFDASGKLYFVARKNYDDSGNWVNGGQVIYQFDPAADAVSEMVAAVEGTNYDKMQISKDGQWIFASGSRYQSSTQAYFLRAIPVNNPNRPVNVCYSSSDKIYTNNWVYDDNSGIIYFIVKSGNNSGLFTASKEDDFAEKKFLRQYVGQIPSENGSAGTTPSTNKMPNPVSELFDGFYMQYYNRFDWVDAITDDNCNFVAEKMMEFILNQKSWSGYIEKEDFDDVGWESHNLEGKVDIRFDYYENQTGALKYLYLLTKGKKNEEALEALDCWGAKVALAFIATYSDYFNYSSGKGGYEHNFLSEILYVKGTDTLLRDSEDVIVSYYENYTCEYNDETYRYEYHGSSPKEIKGTDVFVKNGKGYYRDGNTSLVVDFDYSSEDDHGTYVYYDFKKSPSETLDYFFSFCNVSGEKEFRLTSFKDDDKYGALYTTLKDEEALEWLESDAERLSLFVNAIANGDEYFGQYTDSYYVEKDRKLIAAFLAKTCFIKDTDEKAISVIFSDNGSVVQIEYYPYYSQNASGLTVTEKGVYYEYSNLNSWWSNDNSPYYYIVHVADSDGNILEKINKIDLPDGKVVNSMRASNKMFLQYSLMNSSGSELGYHHIYSVNLDDGEIMNHFDKVANRNALEVISYSVGGSNLYFSAVCGTAVENQIVDINTNECNPLGTERKMVAVFSF